MRKNFLLSALVALGLVGVLIFGAALAQEDLSGGTGFRITDPLKNITIEAGESVNERIAVRNVTEDKQVARAIVEDFGPSDDESGTPKIFVHGETEELSPYSIQGFVVPIRDTELEPGEEKFVDVTLVVPADASPGSYFGVVRFVSVIDQGSDAEGAAVSLTASVGVIFLVTVPGPTVDLISLEQVAAANGENTGSFFSTPPDTLVLRLRNDGNTFQAPFGDLRILDWNGSVIQEISFNDSLPRSNVLPDSIRRFEEGLSDIGSFGRFKIEGFVSYGDGSNIIEINSTFWVIPWVTVAIITLLVIALSFFGTRGIKAYNRNIIKKAKGKSVKNMN